MTWEASSFFNSREQVRRLRVRFGTDQESGQELDWAVQGSEGEYVLLDREGRTMILPGTYGPADIETWIAMGRNNPNDSTIRHSRELGRYVQTVVLRPPDGGEPLL